MIFMPDVKITRHFTTFNEIIKKMQKHTWTGCNPSLRFPMPSTVITCIPSTEYSGAKHAFTAWCLVKETIWKLKQFLQFGSLFIKDEQ